MADPKTPADSVTVITVKVTPARGLERSIRAAYGLDGAGMWKTDSVNALAKIAQWLDKDEEMQVFFR